MQRILFLLIVLIVGAARASETIELDETELQQETVLPKFDRPDVVKNRNVVTANKFEISPYFGSVVTEPIYGQYKVGLGVAYHWNEDSDFSLNFGKFLGGLNGQYTNSLYSQWNLDFHRAPTQEYSVFGNYESKFAYGKLSMTKQGVVNVSAYWLAGLGAVDYSSKMEPGLDLGLGTRFYFTKTFSLKFDFKFQYAAQPSPFLAAVNTSVTPPPSPSSFEDKWEWNNLVELGVSFLF